MFLLPHTVRWRETRWTQHGSDVPKPKAMIASIGRVLRIQTLWTSQFGSSVISMIHLVGPTSHMSCDS